MKNIITEMKTILDTINRLDDAEKQINDLENTVAEIIKMEEQKQKSFLK